jgi:hypothetical protein
MGPLRGWQVASLARAVGVSVAIAAIPVGRSRSDQQLKLTAPMADPSEVELRGVCST